MPLSLLDLAEQVDSSPSQVNSQVWSFRDHTGVLLGNVLPFIAEKLSRYDIFESSRRVNELRLAAFNSFELRNSVIADFTADLRAKSEFNVLNGWRNELYPVYNKDGLYFLIERSAACLLGLVTYGVHITGYIPATETINWKFWIPTRSSTKPTWPGYLDNTVAGGLGFPHGPYETCLKECAEEAGLGQSIVEQALRSAGVLTYEFQLENTLTDEKGVFQPEVEYVYDLPLLDSCQPHPVDGEVASFELLTVDEVLEALHAGKFKYNCALVLIDFMIRHGILTPENTPNYLSIVEHCHRKLSYPLRP